MSFGEQSLNMQDIGDHQTEFPVPNHIAFLMDGNGRWARARNMSRAEGHRAGAEHILDIVRSCADLGVSYLTLHSFSTENWQRPREEVEEMFNLIEEFLDREIKTIHAWGIRLFHLGQCERLPKTLVQKMGASLKLTSANTGMNLVVAINYGSRADMVAAVKKILTKGINAATIDEQTFATFLSTAMFPSPDLIIRTSGEQRLSNFLLWESVDSLFVSLPCFWPDFTPDLLGQIIRHTWLNKAKTIDHISVRKIDVQPECQPYCL